MIVLIKLNYNSTAKPYHLNPQASANKTVGNMFGRRKKDSSAVQNACPYCGTPNEIGAKECKLCYYDLSVSAREQPMATPSSAEDDIMTTLLGEDASEAGDDDYAVEAVLSLDDVTIEIDQFDTSEPGQEAEFAFIASSGPTLSEVQDYTKPEEVELSPDDAPKKQVDFVVPNSNPLDEVAEPVHTGQGSVFFNSENSNDEMTGSVGPSNIRNMEPEVITDDSSEQHLNINLTDAQDDISETPDLPDIFTEPTQREAITETAVETTPELPDIPAGDAPSPIADTPDLPDIPSESTTSHEAEIAEAPKQAPAPTPQFNGRIWPWPAKSPWDERQVYREVVSMLELVKTGKLTQTAQQLDRLGPHLDANLDMLAHIGTIMRYLGREEHLQWMLKMAQRTYPNDANVAKALTHLS